MKPLTPKQRKVYDFIVAQRVLGKSPSLHEIQQWLELSSRSHAKHFVTELAEKGWITYTPNVPYSIELVNE